MEAQAKRQLDLERLSRDIATTAALCDVPYKEDVIRTILEVYEDYFLSAAVSFRTTNRPAGKRDLSIRYVDVQNPQGDPYDRALKHGFLTQEGHPIENLIPDAKTAYPILGYGIDLGASHGFEKIWPLFSEAIPIEKAYDLPAMPDSVRNYADYFAKYDLNLFSLFAVDYWHKTMNIYFPIKDPTPYPPERIAAMIADLGFQVPSQEELELNAQTGIIYYTFSWDSPHCERLSYGVPHMLERDFPTHLDPLFARLYQEAPTLTDEPRCAFMTAYGPNNSDYLKIEIDYTGTMMMALGAAIMVLP